MAVKEDLVQGSGMNESADGMAYVRVFKVSSLSRTPTSNFHWRARLEVTNNKPGTNLGTYHPTIPELLVERITSDPVVKSRSQAIVKVFYRDLGTTRIRINGVLTQELTRFDKDGNILKVHYKRGEGNSFDATGGNTGEVHYAQVPTIVPGSVLEIERFENAARDGGSPLTKQKLYKAKLNSATFQNSPKHTWRCLDISGEQFGKTTLSGIRIWHVIYRFEFIGFNTNGILNTFDPVLIWLDRHSGHPAGDINPKAGGFPSKKSGNGYRQVELLPQADFNKLILPNVAY